MASTSNTIQLNEVSIACSTPLKSSQHTDVELDWPSSPILKTSSWVDEETNSPFARAVGPSNHVDWEIQSSDEELFVPCKSSARKTKPSRKRDAITLSKKLVKSLFEIDSSEEEPFPKTFKPRQKLLKAKSTRNKISPAKSSSKLIIPSSSTRSDNALKSSPSQVSSRKVVAATGAARLRSPLSTRTTDRPNSLFDTSPSQVYSRKVVAATGAARLRSPLSTLTTDRPNSLKSSPATKRKLSFKMSILPAAKSPINGNNSVVKEDVKNKKTIGGSVLLSSGPRRSTRPRATPTSYWTGEKPKYRLSNSKNKPATPPRAIACNKAAKPVVKSQDRNTDKPSPRKETRSTCNTHQVFCTSFQEAVFEDISVQDGCVYQRANTMDVYGLSSGFYRLPPGAATNDLCCYEHNTMYTVLENSVSFEIDGLMQEFHCYTQMHIIRGISHRAINASRRTSLLQYVNIIK